MDEYLHLFFNGIKPLLFLLSGNKDIRCILTSLKYMDLLEMRHKKVVFKDYFFSAKREYISHTISEAVKQFPYEHKHREIVVKNIEYSGGVLVIYYSIGIENKDTGHVVNLLYNRIVDCINKELNETIKTKCYDATCK